MQKTHKPFYKRGRYWTIVIIISVLVAFVIYFNIRLVHSTEKIWIQSEGQLRLSNITSSVENSLTQAESFADSYAAQLELMIQESGNLKSDVINNFVCSQNKTLYDKTDGLCFSTYVAYNNKLYIENFVPDETFHLSERMWYVGAKKNQGNIYITAPYVDANTGNMCYSVSMLLNDGETIIGLDFYMDTIQQYIEKMDEQIDGISMIVDENGMIVGHNDASLVGKDYTVLEDNYTNLIKKVFNLYGDFFEYTMNSDKSTVYTVFSDKTTYGWYLIVCLPSSSISSGINTSTLAVNAMLIVIWITFIIIFTLKYRKHISLKEQLISNEIFIKNAAEGLKAPVTEISQQIQFSEKQDEDFFDTLKQSVEELKRELDNMTSFRKLSEHIDETKDNSENIKSNVKYKRYSVAIIIILLAASVISVAVNTYTQLNYVTAHMQNEEDVYYSQTKSWIDTNISITNDLALNLGAQPDLYKDYDKAVKYIDNVVGDNTDISVAYIVNPAWEHTVIMNNGWEPDDPEWHVEERDWYVDTILSDDGFNISTPYQDEQTGMYCVTFSQIVYDEYGNIVGLIGVDFYMDALINILSESYTSDGYAFLTDPSYIILNHPSQEYQMSLDSSVNGAETEYRNALVSEKLTLTKDYDSKYTVVLAQREPKSGFTVVTVRDVWTIYGTLVVTDIVLVVVFLVSIISVLIITRYMSKQQEKLNHDLQEAADKAIAAGKAKSSFLAQMSHEIRTPINAVLGMNEMILRESKEDSILDYATNAFNAGKTLLSIINDVLDISKIEAGKLEIVDSEYDIYSLVTDCYNMTSGRAEKKNLLFNLSIDENLPSKLFGDMFHLRQIIVNLLTNAIKYTNEGSVELIFTGECREDILTLKVSVRDTGIGLTKESMEHLFTSFQRFDLKRNQSVEGTGLGLSICSQLAELMHGRIDVESLYGKGSTFTCIIDQKIISHEPVGKIILDQPKSHQNMENTKKFTAPDAHILVVDDVKMNLIVFSSLLKEHQLNIDSVTSGKQCLKMIKEQKYDVIFMDHMMPEMDGMETFAHMGEMEHLNQDTPVIMLTANAISGEKEKYLSAGFSSYLTKPIQSYKLEDILLKYLPEDKIIFENSEVSTEGEVSDDKKVTASDTDIPTEDSELYNIELGLNYSGGDMDIYREILSLYMESGPEKLSRIRLLYGQEAWKDYVTEVHALKSTSLTIGSKLLSERAAELEKAGKSGNYDIIKEKNEDLLSLYQNVLDIAGDVLKGLQKDKSENVEKS